MVKTAAQRAARRKRRQAVAAASSRKGGARKPIVVVREKVTVRANGKRKRRNRNKGGGVGSRDSMTSDGVSHSRTIVNNSSICDTFKMRREKVANISGSSAFTIAQSLYLNPGNSTLFPIFSQIAATYEEYKMRHIHFEFVTEAYTSVGTTSSAGKCIMVTQFDQQDPTFTSDQQAEDYCGAVSFRPYANAKYNVETKTALRRGYDPLKTYYVNYSSNAGFPSYDTSGASKFYNVGLFNFITASNAVTTEIGELYVVYSFDMIRPKLQQTVSAPTAGVAAHSICPSITTGVFGGNGTWTQQVPTASSLTLTNVSGGGFHISGLQVTGNYMVVFYVNSTAGTSTTDFTPAITSGAVALNNQNQDTTYRTDCPATSASAATGILSFTATAALALVTSNSITVVGTTVAEIFVYQLPTALVSAKPPVMDRLTRIERLLQRIPAHLLCESEDEADEKGNGFQRVTETGALVERAPPLKRVELPPIPKRAWFSSPVSPSIH